MKICHRLIVLILSFLVFQFAVAEDLYVRPGGGGARSGSDWNNAWGSFSEIKWGTGAGQVGAGDTLWIAGGTYSSRLQIGASGSSGNPINIKRVRSTDSTATAAAGWSSSFDSQVVISTTGSCVYFYQGVGSYVNIDGRVPSGIRVNYANGGRGVEIDGSVNFTDISLLYIEAAGPGPIVQTNDTRGFDLTTAATLTNLTVAYCEAHHSDTLVQVTRSVNLVIEHSDFHHAGAINAATYHPNVIYLGTASNATIRYNKLREIDVEGLFFGDPGNNGVKIYGNLFYQGSSPRNSGRGIEFDNSADSRDVLIYNNTFVDLPLFGVSFNNGKPHPGAVVRNNIFFNTGANFGPAAHDYNYFSGSNQGEANGIGSGTSPFVNPSAYDYRIVSTVASNKPKDKGANLGTGFNIDRDGNLRGADGAWDIGAYEYSGGGGGTTNTPPTISGISNQTTTTGAAVGPIAFTIADAQTAATSLTVQGASTNTALVPTNNITFGGSGTNRTVTVTPASGQTGSATITVTVSDGIANTNTSFGLTVNAPSSGNTPPTISSISSQTTMAGVSAGPIAFTIGDAQTAATSLTLQGASSNTTLVPVSNITFGGSGTNRTVSVMPASGQTGSATITVTVSDGTASTSTSFGLTVAAPQQVSGGLVASYSFSEGSGTTVADLSGNGNSGSISGASWTTAGKSGNALNFDGVSNLVLVKSSPTLGFSQAMTLQAWVYPTASQSGWRTIVQKEVDSYFLHASSNGAMSPAGGGTFNTSVSFTAAPSAISVNAWTHLAVTYDGSAMRLYVNGTQVASKAQTGAIQSNSNGLRIGGNVPYGEYFKGIIDEVRVYNRALSATEIQSDMQAPVQPPVATNTAPTISSIASQSTSSGVATNAIGFTIGDQETAATSLTLNGGSSNTTLVPLSGITFGGSGTSRTVTVTPATGQTGSATITVTVSDGTASASTSFALTVSAPAVTNTAPTIATIPSQTTTTGVATSAIGFTIGDKETAATSLTLKGASSNTTLVPLSGITFGGSGTSRTVTVTPATGQTGSATITVTVSDGTASASTSFALTVSAPAVTNTAPTIATIPSQTTTTGVATSAIGFTIGDKETAATSLTLKGASSNTTLVPLSGITFGGSGTSRTVTVTPATGQIGSATITVTVSDGTANTNTSFGLTVNAEPSPTTGLIAAYSFNEGAGTTVADHSGNGNTGDVFGATWTAAGKAGGALNFDGISNLVLVNGSPSLGFSKTMTLQAWVYPTASQTGWRTIVQKQVDSYFLHASSNRAMHPAGGGTFKNSVSFTAAPSAVSVNAWTHLAVTYDGTAVRLYINGAQVSSKAQTGAIESNSNGLRIGGNVPYGEYFKGIIDEVRVYDRALSATEIQSDMQEPVAAPAVPWAGGDIGAVGLAGSDLADVDNVTVSVKGSGADIWGTEDGFRYVYRALRGDGMIEARVDSVTNTDPWAKAGVMIRGSLAANAPNVLIFVKPSNEVRAQARLAAGATTASVGGPAGTQRHWVRLVRTGDKIVASSSTDRTTWTTVGTYTVSMGQDVYVGLAVTAHNNAQVATGVFYEPYVK